MEKMIIVKSGYNGSATFSILAESNRKPIVKGKSIKELPDFIIKLFPEIAKKIAQYYKMDFSGDLPEEMNLSLIGSDTKADLIKNIAMKLLTEVKV